MKKTLTTMALVAVLGVMAVSCHKEQMNETMRQASDANDVRRVNYTVDGEMHQIELCSDEAWDAFVSRMMNLAQNGHVISMVDEEAADITYAAKEAIVFRTPNQQEAEAWSERMVKDGYTVEVAFDKKNGEFICVATRK